MLCLSTISACGGSSGSGDVERAVSIEATPIRVFLDASGVARIVTRTDSEQLSGYVIAPDLAQLVQQIQNTRQVEPLELRLLTVVDQGPNTTIRTGAFVQNGLSRDVTAAITTDEDAALIFIEDPIFDGSILLTEGQLATNVPTNGTATYSGVFGMQRADGSPELGEFTATAEFSGNPTISLNGNTSNFGISGSGIISGGSFASATMVIADGSSNVAATMNGDFHGSGANSIAGVIYSNDDGSYRGGFVGSQ